MARSGECSIRPQRPGSSRWLQCRSSEQSPRRAALRGLAVQVTTHHGMAWHAHGLTWESGRQRLYGHKPEACLGSSAPCDQRRLHMRGVDSRWQETWATAYQTDRHASVQGDTTGCMDIDVTTRPTRRRAKARAPCGPCNTIVLQTPNVWNREYIRGCPVPLPMARS